MRTSPLPTRTTARPTADLSHAPSCLPAYDWRSAPFTGQQSTPFTGQQFTPFTGQQSTPFTGSAVHAIPPHQRRLSARPLRELLTWKLFSFLATEQSGDDQQGGTAAHRDIGDIKSWISPDDDAAIIAPVKEQEIDDVT